MRNRLAGSVALLLAHAGFVLAQGPAPGDTPVAPAPVAFASEPASDAEADAGADRRARFQITAEYLLWWVKNGPVPAPLVTTGSLTDPRPGAAGQPGTVVLFGDAGIDYRAHSGGRLTGDFWLDDAQTVGLEGIGFVTETHTIHFGHDSDKAGTPVLARPFVSAETSEPAAKLVTAPGALLGGIDVFSDSRLWGAEANAVFGVYRGDGFRADVLVGFRYLALDENIRISQSSTLLANGHAGFFGVPVPPTDIISITDFDGTSNEFYGGQVGGRGEYRSGRWWFDFLGKAALGATRETYRVVGLTKETNAADLTLTGSGGLYALASNGGVTSRSRFAFAPEVGVGVGCQVASWMRVRVGYSILWWDDVARPGDEINPHIDPRQVPSSPAYAPTAGPLQPSRLEGQSNYWAQGLTFGVEFGF
jgi:hypothetical protein